MGNVVHRTTFEVLYSVNTPDYPSSVWIINPANLPALVGTGTPTAPQVPKLYWTVDPPGTNGLREMTPSEKSVVDTANEPLNNARAERKDQLTFEAETFMAQRYPEERQRQFINLKQNATGQALASLNQYYNWSRSVYSGLKSAMAQVDAASTIPEVQAVSFDSAPYVQTDPHLALASAI